MQIESQKELISHQPQRGDPVDRRITTLIQEQVLKTHWAQQCVKEVHRTLIAYYKETLQRLKTNPEDIHDSTQRVVAQIAKVTNSKVFSGEEYLASLPKGKPCFLAGNHFGFYKLTNVRPMDDFGKDAGLKEMHALPTFFAAFEPVAKALGDNLYLAAFKFPGEFGELQEPAGWITIPINGTGGVEDLAEMTREKIRQRQNYALSVLPEGGTSGKRNGGGPYSLEQFRTGAFVVAGMLQVPIIPVAQFFNSNEGEGFEIGVFPPITPKKPGDVGDPKIYFKNLVRDTRGQMQEWLNERVAAVYS